MGGDERAIRRMLPPGWKAVSFPWPEPLSNESLPQYCARPEAQAMLQCDALLGFSFGALPVLELTKKQANMPVLLISCAIHRKELPSRFRLPGLGKLLTWCPPNLIRKGVMLFLKLRAGEAAHMKSIVLHIPPQRHYWALQNSLRASYTLPENAWRLHGQKDTLFPAEGVEGAEEVEGGHLLWRDCPSEMRNWLTEKLAKLH